MGVRIARAVVVLLAACTLIPEVRPATPRQLQQAALEAMSDGRYDKARRLLEQVLSERPGDPGILYNLACCLSRTGDLKAAARRLEAACDAGLRNPGLLRSDPDLDPLRASPQGKELLARLIGREEKAQRLRGVPHFFEAPALGNVRVVPPRTMDPGRRYPLVLILHGHGGRPEPYAAMFENSEAKLQAIIAAPYGPYPITHQQGHGYSWYTEPWLFQDVLTTGGPAEDREARRAELERSEQAVTGRHVFAALEAVQRNYPVDPDQIFLVGHSEGGVLAYHLGLLYPDRFAGLVIVASRLRDADAAPERLAGAAGRLQVLICHSRQDRQVEFSHARSAQKILKNAGIETRLAEYAGGHGMSAPLIRDIDRWIRER